MRTMARNGLTIVRKLEEFASNFNTLFYNVSLMDKLLRHHQKNYCHKLFVLA